ncbi:MAG: type II secretion system minor pseudopilin GspJ [Hyphomonadaceae bacterium]|nr:type II secretion system minor pseudopilin GspJ [Hyphomonadaceae bacterium]
MRAHPPSDAGFTLVEALVSLFVFSLIASGCVAMLMQSVASQRDVGAAHAALRELQTARALLSSDMLQVAPRRTRLPAGGMAPVFASDAGGQGIAFVRSAAEPDPTLQVVGRLSAVAWVIEDGRLLRRSRDALDPLDGATPQERVVFQDLKEARFEFYDGQAWRPTWGSTSDGAQMPGAIALVGVAPRYGAIRMEVIVEPAS